MLSKRKKKYAMYKKSQLAASDKFKLAVQRKKMPKLQNVRGHLHHPMIAEFI